MRRALPDARVAVGLLLALGSPLLAQAPPNQTQQAQQAQQELRTDSASAQDVHPNDSPEYRGYFIQTRNGRSSLRILGSLRAFGLYDIKGLQGTRDFSVYDIPVGATNVREGRAYMEASQTRFGLETHTRAQQNTPAVFGRLEADFRGDNNSLRLRHAFLQFGAITVGQTWTTAAHVSALPTTVDVEGPNSAISLRSVQVRFTRPLRPGLVAAVAVENPSLDATQDSSVSSVSPRIPDVVGRLRNVSGDRELQVSGILRTLPYRDSAGSVRDLGAWGLEVSGRYSLRERKDEIVFQAVWGRGISRYVAGFTGRGLDVTIDSATGQPYATLLRGAYVSYGRLVRAGLRAYGTAGYSRINNRDFEPGSAFKRGTYAAFSVFQEYPWGARVGSEVTWGRRVNKDGAADTALRIQAVMYYDF